LQLLTTARDLSNQGFVAVPNKSMRLVLQGVGTRFEQFMTVPGNQRTAANAVGFHWSLNPAQITSHGKVAPAELLKLSKF